MSASAMDRVTVIKPGQTYVGKQGFTYGAGASAETVGAKHICMNVLPMSPGARAKAHYHEGIETIAYMLVGECAVYYGDHLEHRVLYMRAIRLSFQSTCRMRRATKATHRARGSWCIPQEAIRTASCCCLSSTSTSPKDWGRRLDRAPCLISKLLRCVGRYWHKADMGLRGLNVCFGGKADIIRA